MKTKFTHSINYLAVLTAIISFILGTVLLLLFKTTGDSYFVRIGYLYTILATFTNTILLLLIVINSIRYYKDCTEHISTMLIVIVNIPITIFYLNLL